MRIEPSGRMTLALSRPCAPVLEPLQAVPPSAVSKDTQTPAPPPAPVVEAAKGSPDADTDFPTGWVLNKESWQFHRQFHRIFRHPMRRGEYSHLLRQVRHGNAEHLWEDCWRVTLPERYRIRAVVVRATPWQLIVILPKDWQPPVQADADENSPRETAALGAL
jgi:hypothetical protein